ncbi:MAG: S-adenosylmethionine:tRNA ribosyltransferase-isomerase, partial [Elusimicrobiota bacterium]
MENVIDDLQLSSYEFEVPKELIAQAPLAERDASKLLVVRRQNESIEHRQFRDIVEYLDAGDCLVINKTKVVPVRLFGKKETGGIVEALFLDPREFSSGAVRALLKPWMDPGKKIIFSGGLIATVQGRAATGETIL